MTQPRPSRRPGESADAPLLFRLPNLHAEPADDQAVDRDWRDSAAQRPASETARLHPHSERSVAGGLPRGEVYPGNADRGSYTPDFPAGESSMDRLSARGGLVALMVLIACCAWLAGRRTTQSPGESAARPAEVASLPGGESRFESPEPAESPISDRRPDLRTALAGSRQAVDQTMNQPTDNAAADAATVPMLQPPQSAITASTVEIPQPEAVSDFYVVDDADDDIMEADPNSTFTAASENTEDARLADNSTSAVDRSRDEAPEEGEAVDVAGVFGNLSLDDLAPPENAERTSGVERAAAADETMTNWQSTETPNTPSFDAEPMVADAARDTNPGRPQPRLSSTPNDVPDWSRYLPGGESVRAASSQSPSQHVDGPVPPTGRQAFFLDSDRPY